MPIRSTHIGGSPIRFSLPGVQTQPLLPWRRILDMLPCMSISATVASRVICDGPACIARAILIARSSSSISPWAGRQGERLVAEAALHALVPPGAVAHQGRHRRAEEAQAGDRLAARNRFRIRGHRVHVMRGGLAAGFLMILHGIVLVRGVDGPARGTIEGGAFAAPGVNPGAPGRLAARR
ncbi:hypothetical protein [Burkholderia gladioli]|uniref:hypothetical protein n=1 Tax=Burkholderia gladioli TaxID=28095 RepID=UPI0016415742|nr:hypothetical protein [Burkholderia gladioli]